MTLWCLLVGNNQRKIHSICYFYSKNTLYKSNYLPFRKKKTSKEVSLIYPKKEHISKMKKAILFFAILLVASSSFAQNRSDKVLVKSMNPEGTTAINFDFRNKGVESEPWDEGFIRVELEITANFPEAVLAQLVKAGRYTMTSQIEGDVFNILAKNLDKAVTIGGKDLDDHVRVYIQTPGYYAVSDGVLQKNFPGTYIEGLEL